MGILGFSLSMKNGISGFSLSMNSFLPEFGSGNGDCCGHFIENKHDAIAKFVSSTGCPGVENTYIHTTTNQ